MQRDGGPGGAGGAGNPLGGSFTGPAQGINIVGDHAYAASGLTPSGVTTESTLLQFRTGNYYFVGYFHFLYSNDTSQDMTYKLYFNDSIVWQYVAQTAQSDVEGRNDVYILIPAYTQIKATHESDGAERESCAFMTGRIYRG